MTDHETGPAGWLPPKAAIRRQPPYRQSIGWAILAWVVTVGVVYLVSQVLDMPSLGGWIGFGGFLVGYWFGGTRGGITGRSEWLSFALILSAVAFAAFSAGIFIYAMAEYG